MEISARIMHPDERLYRELSVDFGEMEATLSELPDGISCLGDGSLQFSEPVFQRLREAIEGSGAPRLRAHLSDGLVLDAYIMEQVTSDDDGPLSAVAVECSRQDAQVLATGGWYAWEGRPDAMLFSTLLEDQWDGLLLSDPECRDRVARALPPEVGGFLVGWLLEHASDFSEAPYRTEPVLQLGLDGGDVSGIGPDEHYEADEETFYADIPAGSSVRTVMGGILDSARSSGLPDLGSVWLDVEVPGLGEVSFGYEWSREERLGDAHEAMLETYDRLGGRAEEIAGGSVPGGFWTGAWQLYDSGALSGSSGDNVLSYGAYGPQGECLGKGILKSEGSSWEEEEDREAAGCNAELVDVADAIAEAFDRAEAAGMVTYDDEESELLVWAESSCSAEAARMAVLAWRAVERAAHPLWDAAREASFLSATAGLED